MQIKEVTIGKLISATYLICSLILICACSDSRYDEQLDSLYDEREVICVETQMKAETKGTPATDASQLKDMGVFCAWTKNEDWQATAALNKMFNRKMEHNGSGAWAYEGDPVKWDAENANQRYSFFSYAPFATGLYDATSNAVGNGIVVTESITTGIPQLKYTVPANCANQPDLMVAVPKKDIRPTLGKVPMDMKHALTCIGFQAKGASKLKIKSIEVEGINTSGTLSCDGAAIAWSELSGETIKVTAGIEADLPLTDDSFTGLTAADGYLMMIPQTLTADAKLVITLEGEDQRELSLKDQVWEAGKRINYQIIITDAGTILVSPENLGIPQPGTNASNRNITVTTDPATLKWTFTSENSDWFKISLNPNDTWNNAQSTITGEGSQTIYTFAPANETNSIRTTFLDYGEGKVTVNQFPKDEGIGELLPNSYVGAFWKSEETQERLIKIPHGDKGEWAASVVWMDARWQEGDIFFSDNSDNWTPGNTSPVVINVADRLSAVSGTGDIQFRIGLKESSFTPSPEVPARYAVIALTHTNNTKIQYIYLRQGEGADYVMTGANAVKWSVYNLGNINGTPGTTPATPVSFPTQGGYFYQWGYSATTTDNKPRPYSPVGRMPALEWLIVSDFEANNYSKNATYSLDKVSPTGFTLPINDHFTNLLTAKNIKGYYADGFFDRYQVQPSQSDIANSAVLKDEDNVGYIGRLFFNPDSKASLFFPASGYRSNGEGYLNSSGIVGYYWSSTSEPTNYARSMGYNDFGVGQYQDRRGNGFAIRCVPSEPEIANVLYFVTTGVSNSTLEVGKWNSDFFSTEQFAYFKFGSVQGISNRASIWGNNLLIYNPAQWNLIYNSYADIKYANQEITKEFHDANVKNGLGDPCRLAGLTRAEISAGKIDNGKWRLPTTAENCIFFNGNPNASFVTTSGFKVLKGNEELGTPDMNGYFFPNPNDTNGAFLPAAGYRSSAGSLAPVDTEGRYWSSSPSNAYNAFFMQLKENLVNSSADLPFNYAYTIRCVRQ